MIKRNQFLAFIAFLVIVTALFAADFYLAHPRVIVGVSMNKSGELKEVALLARDGLDYVWISNNNLPLKYFTSTFHNSVAPRKYTYLINPEGEGFIVLRHNTDEPFFTPNMHIYQKSSDGNYSVISAFSKGVYPAALIKSRGPR